MSDTHKNPAPDTEAMKFLKDAYSLADEGSMQEFYAKWAKDYDRQLEQLGYMSPAVIAQLAMTHIPNTAARILDIGCGTGLTCKPLAESGYQNLYGVDLSRDMINVANSRNIYKHLAVADITQPLDYDAELFHGVISTGTFTHGHVGPEPLDEILRVMRPGGILACTIHQDLWHSRGFDRALEDLESAGRLTTLSRESGPFFEGNPPEGWFCIYQKPG